MKASDALERSKNASNGNIGEIYKVIAKAAQAGDTSCFLYRKLAKGEINQLTADGYKFKEEYDQREGGYLVSIDWAKPSKK